MLNRLSARQPPISSDFIPATSYYTPTLKLSTAYHGDAIQLFHEPAAQTDGDSIVWFRLNDIIATGGIFSTTNYPKIDLARGGSIDGEIDALNHIIEIAFPEFRVEGGTLMVPSSGRLGDMADVAYYRDMVTIIRDRVKDMLVNKKMTLEQVKAQKPTRDYDGYYVADAAQYSPDQFVEVVYTSLAAAIAAVNKVQDTWQATIDAANAGDQATFDQLAEQAQSVDVPAMEAALETAEPRECP